MRDIQKTFNGFQEVCDSMTLVWSKDGSYKGQWQPNALESEPPELFIGPDPSGKCFVADLTKEEMEAAT